MDDTKQYPISNSQFPISNTNSSANMNDPKAADTKQGEEQTLVQFPKSSSVTQASDDFVQDENDHENNDTKNTKVEKVTVDETGEDTDDTQIAGEWVSNPEEPRVQDEEANISQAEADGKATDDGDFSAQESNKEVEPLATTSSDMQEVVENPDATIDLDPDVEATGVEAIPSLPQISEEAKNAGVTLAKEAAPILNQNSRTGSQKQAMTKEEAEQVKKKPLLFQDASNSDLWLQYLWLRYYMLLNKK